MVMKKNKLLILPLMPTAHHFYYCVKHYSCLDNKHLMASSSEGGAAGGFGYVCVTVCVCKDYFPCWSGP